MNCLIAAATAQEIGPLLNWLTNDAAAKENSQPDVLITGIGLTAATYHLSRQLQLKKYQLVIQAGVAGCFDKKIPLGTVVAIKADCIADQGVVEKQELKTIFNMHLQPAGQFPYRNAWLVNPDKVLLKKTGLRAVKAVSVNEITSSKTVQSLYEQAFRPVAESMEGAALHYTCLMEGIPFLQLRAMSNYVTERNKQHWNMGSAIAQLNKVLIQLLQEL